MIDIKIYELEPRAYLNLFIVEKQRIHNFRSEIQHLEEDIGKGLYYDGLPKKGEPSHPTEEAALKLAETRRRYQEAIKRADVICNDIEETINSLDDPKSSRLLSLRYMRGLSWHKVASSLYYSEAYVKKELHQKALEDVQILMRRKKEKLIGG